jgi:hypothetical protein
MTSFEPVLLGGYLILLWITGSGCLNISDSENCPFWSFQNPQRPIGFHERTDTFLGGYLEFFLSILRTMCVCVCVCVCVYVGLGFITLNPIYISKQGSFSLRIPM